MPRPQTDVYKWPLLGNSLEALCYCLTTPFLYFITIFAVSAQLTTHESNSTSHTIRRWMTAIVCLACSLPCFVPAIFGQLLWVAVCYLLQPRQHFRYQEFPDDPLSQCKSSVNSFKSPCPSTVTFLTANVLLANEVFVSFNNNQSAAKRLPILVQRLLNQAPQINRTSNNLKLPRREDIVIDQIPDVDVVLWQEVFGKKLGSDLSKKLSSKYKYFIYYATRNTCDANFFCMDSGLFAASKFPIICADFKSFSFKNSYARLMDYGMLFIKLALGWREMDGRSIRCVGYITNLHTQAYQGDKPILVYQLEDVQRCSDEFIRKSTEEDELIVVNMIAGDLNADNMSPGDAATQNHKLYEKFTDVCRERPGKDHSWSIGTEMRQRTLHLPEVNNPLTFRDILLDDTKRRNYLLDADVKEQTYDLMYCNPVPDEDGIIYPKPWGGRRRIDQILVRKYDDSIPNYKPPTPRNIWFSSSFAGLSDHIPVVMEVSLLDGKN
ncbi:sphingomyelin phosphodiesterase 5-like isoform X1 [Oratosquilla oratoria]|uniref:sphingomyelin phosphodiesterase 5-like isoform X1 n=1 Tax=Oratosquilla oratoria TaxID=337810 RepID=UPI003F772FF7